VCNFVILSLGLKNRAGYPPSPKESLSSTFKRKFFRCSPKAAHNGRRLFCTQDVGVQSESRSSDDDEHPRSPSLTRRAQCLLQRIINSPKNRRKAKERPLTPKTADEDTSVPTDATDNTDSACTDTNDTLTGCEGFADSSSSATIVMAEGSQKSAPGTFLI
jgi:hypothetical protein